MSERRDERARGAAPQRRRSVAEALSRLRLGDALAPLVDLITRWRRDTLPTLPASLKKALPIAGFFIVLFWIVVGLFGISHVMPVSCYTTLFNVRYRKYNTPSQYARFFGVSLLALVAARLATLHVALCIVMNVVMPFMFVFMRSSQLNPRRYFPYTMLFVFLQLRPEFLDDMLLELGVLMTCCGVLSVALVIAGCVLRKADENRARLHDMVDRLADELDHMADEGIGYATRRELLCLRSDYAKLAYSVREDANAQAQVSNLYDMFAMLAQRTAYLTGRLEWHEGPGCPHSPYLRKLAHLTREVGEVMGRPGTTAVLTHAEALLLDAETVENDRFRLFYRSYLHMMLMVLRETAPHARGHVTAGRRRPMWHISPMAQLRIAAFRKHPSLDSFELRFSVRCAAVLAVSCAVSLAAPIDHIYWFPLTAFLLIQPYPTESLRRMRTRAAGTVLGCLFVHAVSLLELPYPAVMVLGMVLITCLYAGTPGSTPMAFFATAYALSMASVSIGDRYAIWMRLVCLAAAVALVWVVNRLVMPTSDRTLFLANVHQMFSLIGRYGELLRRSLSTPIDAVTSGEALLHIQMVHSQAAAYAQALPDDTAAARERRGAISRVLFCQWELVCELEQLGFLIRLDAVGEGARPALEQFLAAAAASADPFVVDERIERAEQEVDACGDEDLIYVVDQYVSRARVLAAAMRRADEQVQGRPSYRDEVADI